MTLEDLVDKAINEAILKSESKDEDIEKRKPKPFRYLTDEEIKKELSINSFGPASVMKSNHTPMVIKNDINIISLGDVNAIENIISRHQKIRMIREKME